MSAFYLVFASTRRPVDFLGGKALDWSHPPIGVYQAESAEAACKAAARDNGQMATYAAVGCTPWGIDLIEESAQQLGRTESSNDKIARLLDRMESRDAEIKQLQEAHEHRKLTDDERRAERKRERDERIEDLEDELDIG